MTDERDIFPLSDDRPDQTGGDRLVMQFASFRDFVEQYSSYISESGMFIKTDSPSAVGEVVDFEVCLSDDFRLICGSGEVLWIRATEESGQPAGMALRFVEIDEPSRRLIARLVANHLKDGGAQFDLGAAQPSPPAASGVADSGLGAFQSVSGAPSEPEGAGLGLGEAAGEVLPEAPIDPGTRQEPEQPPSPVSSAFPIPPGPETIALPTSLSGLLDEETEAAEEAALGDAASSLGYDIPDLGTAAPADASAFSSEVAQLTEEVQASRGGIPEVEMPDVTEFEDDYGAKYVAESGGRGRTWIWVISCLVAVGLGAVAAFRYQDRLVEVVPWVKSLVGGKGGEEVAVLEPAATQSSSKAPAEGELATAPAPTATEGVAVDGEAEPVAGDAERSLGTPTDFEDAESAPPDAAATTGADVVAETTGPEEPALGRAEPTSAADEAAAGQVVEPAAVAAEAPASATAAPGGIRVADITWNQTAGGTVVTIYLTGPVGRDDIQVLRVVEGTPREVIKIRGVAGRYNRNRVEVGSAEIIQLRTGFHPGETRNELHIVADLVGPAVQVQGVDLRGNQLVVTFS